MLVIFSVFIWSRLLPPEDGWGVREWARELQNYNYKFNKIN
jgi:hypothetical protein